MEENVCKCNNKMYEVSHSDIDTHLWCGNCGRIWYQGMDYDSWQEPSYVFFLKQLEVAANRFVRAWQRFDKASKTQIKANEGGDAPDAIEELVKSFRNLEAVLARPMKED